MGNGGSGDEWTGGVEQELAPGVRALEHTADVGFEVEAGSLPELFMRAAFGLVELTREGAVPAAVGDVAPNVKTLELQASDLPGLLAAWLRELLYLDEVGGFGFVTADFEVLQAERLRAHVTGGRDPRRPVREIKGVTYHQLEMGRIGETWRARVYFDV